MTKPTAAFHNFANVPKNQVHCKGIELCWLST